MYLEDENENDNKNRALEEHFSVMNSQHIQLSVALGGVLGLMADLRERVMMLELESQAAKATLTAEQMAKLEEAKVGLTRLRFDALIRISSQFDENNVNVNPYKENGEKIDQGDILVLTPDDLGGSIEVKEPVVCLMALIPANDNLFLLKKIGDSVIAADKETGKPYAYRIASGGFKADGNQSVN